MDCYNFAVDERTVVTEAGFGQQTALSSLESILHLLMAPPSALCFLAENLGMIFFYYFLYPFRYQEFLSLPCI